MKYLTILGLGGNWTFIENLTEVGKYIFSAQSVRVPLSQLRHYQLNWLLEHFVAGYRLAPPPNRLLLIGAGKLIVIIGAEGSLPGRSKTPGRSLKLLNSMSLLLASDAKRNEVVERRVKCNPENSYRYFLCLLFFFLNLDFRP